MDYDDIHEADDNRELDELFESDDAEGRFSWMEDDDE